MDIIEIQTFREYAGRLVYVTKFEQNAEALNLHPEHYAQTYALMLHEEFETGGVNAPGRFDYPALRAQERNAFAKWQKESR